MNKLLLLGLLLCIRLGAQGIIEPRMIKQGGATLGQCLEWDGSKWAPDDCNSSGSGTPEGSDKDYQYNNSSSFAGGSLKECATNVVGIGGCTSSYPALRRNTTYIDLRLADDSAYTTITGKTFFATEKFKWALGSELSQPSDGNITLSNHAGNDFGLLQFGGTTSSYPALKRVNASLSSRKADDSAYTPFIASDFNSTSTGIGYYFGAGSSSYPALKRNGTSIDLRLGDDSGYTSIRGSYFNAVSAFQFNSANIYDSSKFKLPSYAGDPTSPANGWMVYNSTANKFRCYENSAWVDCIGGGGAPTDVDYWVGTADTGLSAEQVVPDGVIKSASGMPSAAAASDIVALWTTCSGYLKDDGTCDTPSSALPSQTGHSYDILASNGTSAYWADIGLGLVHDATSLRVDSSTVALLTGTQTIAGDKTLTGDTTFSGEVDISGGTFIPPSGTSLPGTCTADVELFVDSDATDGQQLYICNAAGTGWNLVGDGSATAGADSIGTSELDDASDTPSAGEYVVVASTTTDVEYVTPGTGTVVAIQIVIGNGTDVITAGDYGVIQVPFACTITRANVFSLSGTSGSVAVRIDKDTYANYPPTSGDSICASACPSLSSAAKSTDSTLTGWTKSIAADDVLSFVVTGTPATVTQVTVSLRCTR